MKSNKSALIINGFALLHAVIAVVCRLIGVDDSLVLTLMTMLMTVWLCLVRGYSPEITAACVILVNVVGFMLGTLFARLLIQWNASYLITYPISTFVTTELLGWGIVLLTRLFHATGDSRAWRASLRWIIIAFVVIIVFRFGFGESFSYFYGTSEVFLDTLVDLCTNVLALLVILCANIVYVRNIRRINGRRAALWKGVVFFFYIIITLIVTLMDAYNFPVVIHRGPVSAKEFAGIYMLALILELTVYSIVYIINYATTAERAREQERMRVQEVQFQYNKLKDQISPHFFFNCLNSLDALVCEGRTELASQYIHKLAGIYRYMLGRGEEELVRLSDEMTFVDMYVDLMMLRFGSGLTVSTRIGEGLSARMVVPCSVQLLVENVVKHNVASEEEPMEVEIVAEGDRITVRNALRPKLTQSHESSGHGLNYIRQIYGSLCDRPVEILRTDTEFIVSLPLI